MRRKSAGKFGRGRSLPRVREGVPDRGRIFGAVALAVAYEVGALGTWAYLTFFDGFNYTWWNWIFVVPLNFFIAQFWPAYWAIVRPIFGN